MTKIKDLLKLFHQQLSGFYPKEEIEAIFYRLIEYFYDIHKIDIVLNPNLKIEPTKLQDALIRLVKYEPWQYITGKTEFFGLSLSVNPAVLIPRPETEELVDWIIKENLHKEKLKILDIGTGSGAIAIGLAKNLSNANVYAVDYSEKALKIAQQNAMENKVSIHFIHQDILDDFKSDDVFDIIVSNPPYVQNSEKKLMKKNVLDYEPSSALFAPDENPLIFYDKIINLFKKNTSEKGQLYFEINEFLKDHLEKLVINKGFEKYIFKKDIFEKWRMLKIFK